MLPSQLSLTWNKERLESISPDQISIRIERKREEEAEVGVSVQ